MKFSTYIVVAATVLLGVGAHAEEGAAAAATSAQSQSVTVSTQTTVTPAPTEAAQPTVAPVAKPAEAAATEAKTDTKVDAIKKVRQDIEQKNDSKIVEKLEKTRLEDEQQLSQKIDSANLKEEKKEAPQVVIVQPAPAPTAAAPAKEEKKEEEQREEKHSWYAGLGVGNIQYNGNVITKTNIGVVAGTMIDDKISVEGSLTYSTFSLNNYWGGNYANALFGSMDQYDIGVAVKYIVLQTERFAPYVGGSGNYIYRQYKDRFFYGNFYQYYDNYTTGQNTNSVNASLLAGIDVKLTKRLVLGGEFKYSLPVYHQDNGLITQSYVMAYAKPLEESSFTSWLLSLKYLF